MWCDLVGPLQSGWKRLPNEVGTSRRQALISRRDRSWNNFECIEEERTTGAGYTNADRGTSHVQYMYTAAAAAATKAYAFCVASIQKVDPGGGGGGSGSGSGPPLLGPQPRTLTSSP